MRGRGIRRGVAPLVPWALVLAGTGLCALVGALALPGGSLLPFFFFAIVAALSVPLAPGALAVALSVVVSGVLLAHRPHGLPPLSPVVVATAEGWFLGTGLLVLALAERLRRLARRAATARENLLPRDGPPQPTPQHLYARLVDLAPDALVVIDSAGRVVLFNEAAEGMFGYARDEVLGEGVGLLLPEDPRERVARAGHPVRLGEAPELGARRKDGTVFPCEVALAPLETAQGTTLVSVALRDATRRREQEAALRAAQGYASLSEARYRQLLSSAPVAVVVSDDGGRIILANDAAAAMFGYTPAELTDGDIPMLVPDEVREAHRAYRAAYYHDPGGGVYTMGMEEYAAIGANGHAGEVRGRRKDGSVFPARIFLGHIYHEGRIQIIAICIDLTRQKAAEARVEAARRAAEEAEERFRALLEAAPDAMVVLAEDGRVTFASRQALAFFGYKEGELEGMDVERLLPNGAELLSDRPVGFVRSLSARCKDGRVVEVEASLAPLQLRDMRLVTVALRDLAPRRELEAARVAKGVAERAVAERELLLDVVAHELRTPLTSLSGYVELLEAALVDVPMPDAKRQRVVRALGTLLGQAARLEGLVGQLLDTARISAGRVALDRRETDVAALARSVAEAMALGARHSPGGAPPIALDLPDGPLPAEVDAPRLEQVLRNLLDNALRFSPAGAPVTLEARRANGAEGADGALILAVSDRGPGVPEGERGSLFERFGRPGSGRAGSGLGMGLYISREIVALHGGRIRAEFPAGGGSRFVVSLPARGPRPAAGDGGAGDVVQG